MLLNCERDRCWSYVEGPTFRFHDDFTFSIDEKSRSKAVLIPDAEGVDIALHGRKRLWIILALTPASKLRITEWIRETHELIRGNSVPRETSINGWTIRGPGAFRDPDSLPCEKQTRDRASWSPSDDLVVHQL